MVVVAYTTGVVAMVALFESNSIGSLQQAGWSAVAIMAAATPLEQLSHRFKRAIPAFVCLYILAFILGFFLLNLRLSVEWVIVTLVGVAFISGRIVTFARDWAVFIVVLVAWQVTDGLAGAFHFPLHIRAMIDADKVIGFGTVPSVWLQQHFFDPNHVNWLDVMSVIVYSFHFLLPLTAGFILWLVNRKLYYRYAVAFSVAAIAGFATYVVFPAVPPWMAVMHCANNGSWACDAAHPHHFLPWVPVLTPKLQHLVASGQLTMAQAASHAHWVPGITDVWNFTMKGWISKNHGNVAFGPFHLGFDQVGAIPSEHVMYPSLVFLFFRRQFGRPGYLMLPYIALVMFVIAYMGQHYLIDGVVGMMYASIVYLLVMYTGPAAWHRIRRDGQKYEPVTIGAVPPSPVLAREEDPVGAAVGTGEVHA